MNHTCTTSEAHSPMASTEKDNWPVQPSKFNTATTDVGVYWNKLRTVWQYDLPPPPPEPVPDIWPVSTNSHTCTTSEDTSLMVSIEKDSKPVPSTKFDKAPSLMASTEKPNWPGSPSSHTITKHEKHSKPVSSTRPPP
jgi:hypothetical protein